jgi:hypothetical protein
MRAAWTRNLVVLACLAACGSACRCAEPPAAKDAGPDASDGALPDARQPDARPDARADARTDARVLPDATQHFFCDEPFFKLPIDGMTERTVGVAMQGHRVAWTKRLASDPDKISDIHLLDLSTCIEWQVTSGFRAGRLHLNGNDLVWDDLRDGYQPWCGEIYRHDLSLQATERLTETTQCEIEPKSNGRHIAYRRMETDIDAPSLRLLDRQTGIDIELSPDWTNIESFDLNDRYVVWVAYTQDPLSVGRDVFFHDLAAGETHHLDATYQRYQYWVFLWEDWITIRGNDAHLSGPKHLSLYNLKESTLSSIIEGDYALSAGWIAEGLIVYNTSLYTGTSLLNPSDIELYEITSGGSRRLTTEESNLRVQQLEPPYHLFIHRLFLPDRFQNDYYIANLETLGVLDASGMLLPGDPVIDPP